MKSRAINEDIKARKVDVVIDKDLYEKPSKQIYEHEIPILEDIYGEEMVKEYKRPLTHLVSNKRGKKYHMAPTGKFAEYQVVELDHEEEYMRLEEVYGRHPSIDISYVERSYGIISRNGLYAFGEEEYKGLKVFEEDEPEGSAEEVEQLKRVHKREIELMKLTNAKLRIICKENGLPVEGQENKDTLIQMVLQTEFMPTGAF